MTYEMSLSACTARHARCALLMRATGRAWPSAHVGETHWAGRQQWLAHGRGGEAEAGQGRGRSRQVVASEEGSPMQQAAQQPSWLQAARLTAYRCWLCLAAESPARSLPTRVIHRKSLLQQLPHNLRPQPRNNLLRDGSRGPTAEHSSAACQAVQNRHRVAEQATWARELGAHMCYAPTAARNRTGGVCPLPHTTVNSSGPGPHPAQYPWPDLRPNCK